MSLSKSQRAVLFAMFGGKCAYCGYDLPVNGWHADHIEPVLREWWKKGPKIIEAWDAEKNCIVRTEEKQQMGMGRPENDCVENMFPSCRPCNIDKGCMDLESWREWIEQKPRVLRDNYSAWRHAERFGLIAVVKTKVVFYFESLASPAEAPTQQMREDGEA